MSYTETEASSDELNTQNALLKAILNSFDTGSVLLSPEQKVLFFNKASQRDILQLWGKKVSIGDDFLSYVAPNLKAEFEKEFQKALQGQIINTEREITDSKGNKTWLKGKYLPVYSEDNEPLGVYFTIENNISNEKQQLLNIIQSAGVGTWEWNIQTKEVKRNEQWASILGYTLKELEPLNLGTWEKHVHIEDLSIAKELLNQHLTGKTKIYECELRMKHKDGHWVWILDKGKVLEWDKEGKPLKMYGTHQDITTEKLLRIQLQKHNEMLVNTEEELRQSLQEIHQANMKLEASELMLKAIIDNFPEGSISLIDRDLNLLYTGGAGYKQYDINPQEFTGKPVKELVSESTYEQIISFLPEIFAGNSCSQEIAFRDRMFLNVYQPVMDKDQVVHSFVLASFDITERQKNEEKIKIQNEILVQQNNIFRQIAWLQSHDARRPVANILGLVQLIKTDKKNIQQYIDYLYKAAEDLDNVIHRIVDLIQHIEMY